MKPVLGQPRMFLAAKAGRFVREERGESLVEALVSVLIGGLALLMLAVVIASTSHLITDSRQEMEGYYSQANAFAASAGVDASAQLRGTVALVDESGNRVSLASDDTDQRVVYNVGEVTGKTVVTYQVEGAQAQDSGASGDGADEADAGEPGGDS